MTVGESSATKVRELLVRSLNHIIAHAQTSSLRGATSLLVLSVMAQISLLAGTYSVVEDFSPIHNPSGVWSYGYGGLDWIGPLEAGSDSNPIMPGWSRSLSQSYPGVTRNISGSTIYYSWGEYPTDYLRTVPANDSNLFIRFTAPSSGSYTFAGQFIQLEYLASGVSVAALINSGGSSTTILSGTIGGMGYWGMSVPINFTGILTAGDTVDFRLTAFGSNPGDVDNWGDNTGLKLNVASSPSTVPEPSSLLLLAPTLTFAAVWKRRHSIIRALRK